MRRNWRQEFTDPRYWLKRLARVSCTKLQEIALSSISYLRYPRYQPFDASSVEKTLLIRLDRIGDMVLTTPILQALKVGIPQADLAVLANSYNASVIENNPHVDRVFIFPKEDRNRAEIVLKLREEHFDLIIDPILSPDLSSAMLTSRLKGKYRIGFEVGGRGLFFNLRPPAGTEKKHLLAHHEELLQVVGVSAKGIHPRIYLTPAELRSADLALCDYGVDPNRLRVGIHPGGFYPSQRWFTDRFAAVATELAENYDAQILLFGGKADGETLVQMQKQAPTATVIIPDTGLRGFMATLSRCDLLLCNNSGPLHIATALDVPTISTMGPTVPHLWWPIGDIHTVLRKNLPCSPCQRSKCNWHDCLKLITVDEMVAAATDRIRE